MSNFKELDESLFSSPEISHPTEKQHLSQLSDCFFTLLGDQTIDRQSYANFSETGYVHDATSYALVSLNNQHSSYIFTIAYGEFSHKTFKREPFNHLPFDIYCTDNQKKYNEDYEDESSNPEKYLTKKTLFVANNGNIAPNRNINPPIEIKDLITILRNQIINTKTTPEEFSSFLKNLPNDPTELGNYFQNEETYFQGPKFDNLSTREQLQQNMRIINLRRILFGIGIDNLGCLVGKKESMESILKIKEDFDFTKNKF